MKTICLLCVLCSGYLFSQTSGVPEIIDWSSPETIDPLNSHIDDFLKVNINRYIIQAEDYYKKGEFKQAAQVYLFLLRYKFDDKVILYNLSCCYGKMGEAELASRFLMYAVGSGFLNKQAIEKDHDFDLVRTNPEFKHTEQMVFNHLDNLGQTAYCNAPSYIPFRYRLPDTSDTSDSQALVVAFHGNGDNNDRFMLLAKNFIENTIAFAAPRGTYPFQTPVRSDRRYSWFLNKVDRDFWKKADPLTIEYAFNVICEMETIAKTHQTFVMGFSQGSATACMTGVKYAERIKGIVSIGGVCPEPFLDKEQLQQAGHLKVFIAHGKQDPVISVNEAYKTKALFEKAGCQVTFLLHDGGHVLPESVLKAVSDWVREQTDTGRLEKPLSDVQ